MRYLYKVYSNNPYELTAKYSPTLTGARKFARDMKALDDIVIIERTEFNPATINNHEAALLLNGLPLPQWIWTQIEIMNPT